MATGSASELERDLLGVAEGLHIATENNKDISIVHGAYDGANSIGPGFIQRRSQLSISILSGRG